MANDSKYSIDLEVKLAELQRQMQNAEQLIEKSVRGMSGKHKVDVFRMPTDGEWNAFTQKAAAESAKQVRIQTQLQEAAAQKLHRQKVMQNVQLSAQLQDFGIQVAGGQNPLLAAVQQGSQLSFIYGGLGNAMRALGALITPVSVGLTALGAVVLSVGKNWYDGQKATEAFNKALILTGNYAGASADQLKSLANSQEKISRFSLSSNRDAVAALAGTGAFSVNEIEGLTQSLLNFSKVSGKTEQETAQIFARMRSAPAEFAKDYAIKMGLITAEELKRIQSLEAHGEKQKASYMLQAAVIRQFGDDAKNELSSWDKWVNNAAKNFDRLWRAIGGGGESTNDKLGGLRNRVEYLRSRLGVGLDGKPLSSPELKQAEKELQAAIASAVDSQNGAAVKGLQTNRETEQAEKNAIEKRLRAGKESLSMSKIELELAKQFLPLEKEIADLKEHQALATSDAAKDNIGYIIADKEKALALREILKLQKEIAGITSDDTPESQLSAQKRRLDLQRQLLEAQQKYDAMPDGSKLFDRDVAKSTEETFKKDKAFREENAKAVASLQEQLKDKAEQIGLQMISDTDKRTQAEYELEKSKYMRIVELAANGTKERKDVEEAFNTWKEAREKQLADDADKRLNAARGVSEGLSKYYDELKNKGKAAEESTARVIGSIEDKLMQLVQTGKINARSLFDAIIQEFYRLQIVKPLMASIFAPSGGGGSWIQSGLTALFGGSFSGSSGGTSGSVNYSLSSGSSGIGLKLRPFATGGYTGPGGRNEPAGIVHGGEFVMNKSTVDRVGLAKLMAIQNGGSSGGSPTINVNIDSSTDRAQVQRLVMQGVAQGLSSYHGQVQRGIA